jgi:hypothetical protein
VSAQSETCQNLCTSTAPGRDIRAWDMCTNVHICASPPLHVCVTVYHASSTHRHKTVLPSARPVHRQYEGTPAPMSQPRVLPSLSLRTAALLLRSQCGQQWCAVDQSHPTAAASAAARGLLAGETDQNKWKDVNFKMWCMCVLCCAVAMDSSIGQRGGVHI